MSPILSSTTIVWRQYQSRTLKAFLEVGKRHSYHLVTRAEGILIRLPVIGISISYRLRE